MLDRVAQPAQRARERALAAFSEKDAAKLLALLERFVDVFNEQTRAPIRAETGEKRTKDSGKAQAG
jgi:hypothetical protein